MIKVYLVKIPHLSREETFLAFKSLEQAQKYCDMVCSNITPASAIPYIQELFVFASVKDLGRFSK